MRRIAFLIVLALAGCSRVASSAQPATNTPDITRAEYDKLAPGMYFDEVERIIGGRGVILSRAGSGVDEALVMRWQGQPQGTAVAVIQGGRLLSKTETDL